MLKVHVTRSPDDVKPLIALEELGLPYELAFHESLPGAGAQAATRPSMTDDADARFAIFSPAAALLHLAEQGPGLVAPDRRAAALQWLGWEAAALGPLNDHRCQHHPRLRAVIGREAARGAFELLDRHLAKRAFLTGTFGLADIGVWPWAFALRSAGVPSGDLRSFEAWLGAVHARPAVRRAQAAQRRGGCHAHAAAYDAAPSVARGCGEPACASPSHAAE